MNPTNKNILRYILYAYILLYSFSLKAQYAFEMSVEYAMQVQNSDQYAVSGTIHQGRIENNKTYYLEDGSRVVVKNIISAKSATSVPVAKELENISINLEGKNLQIHRGEILKATATSPLYTGMVVKNKGKALPEGVLTCKVNSAMYVSKAISKPVYIKQADLLDIFFQAESGSVIWIQINNFSQIKDIPHTAKTDTAEKDRMYVCKFALMPKGYRPTDMPNNYVAYEDLKGNMGIVITALDRYKKKISFEFSGILRPNQLLLEEKPTAGLFYLTDGRVDEISWDDF